MNVSFNDLLNRQSLSSDGLYQPIRTFCDDVTRCVIKIQHAVDNRASPRFWISNDIGNGVAGRVEIPLFLRLLAHVDGIVGHRLKLLGLF